LDRPWAVETELTSRRPRVLSESARAGRRTADAALLVAIEGMSADHEVPKGCRSRTPGVRGRCKHAIASRPTASTKLVGTRERERESCADGGVVISGVAQLAF
jgi:hypothetical protein